MIHSVVHPPEFFEQIQTNRSKLRGGEEVSVLKVRFFFSKHKIVAFLASLSKAGVPNFRSIGMDLLKKFWRMNDGMNHRIETIIA